jgi:deoxyribose-phosphate aldolase
LALACLDLTSLNDGDDGAAITALCARASQGAAGVPAAVCVWPRFVAQARAALPAGIRVAAVANFPDGGQDSAAAVAEARAIVDAGGDEVDLVLPWRALRAGDAAGTAALVAAVRAACPGRTLKLILESGDLATPALVHQACLIGLDAGVDFLKTSTGKTRTGATPEAARVMLQAIAAHPRGAQVGFKASGGIRTVADAAVYIALVREILGGAALTPQRLRFGASGLLGDIETVLAGGGEGGSEGGSDGSGGANPAGAGSY